MNCNTTHYRANSSSVPGDPTSTFCGLFLQGGHGERRLWERSAEELEIIRKFTWLHSELVPYIWHHMYRQHETGDALMRPTGHDYHYLFGPDLLVAPIYEDKTTRTVSIPEGRWRYFFDDLEVIEGPKTITRDFPLEEFPAYVRDGAVIPMRISRDYTGIGARDWEGSLTLNIYPFDTADTRFHLSQVEGVLSVSVSREDQRWKLHVEQPAIPQSLVIRLLLPQRPAGLNLGGAPLVEGEHWTYDPERQRLIIRQPAQPGPLEYEVILAG